MAIAFGTPEDRERVFGEDVQPGLKARQEAMRELFDRGFGKAIQAVEMSGPGGGPIVGMDYSRMTAEEFERSRSAGCRRAADDEVGQVWPGHLRNGRCVERWSSVDMYAWLIQLGAVQPLG